MRIKNSIKNIVFGLGSQLILIILSFCSRSIFIYSLGAEYLGVHGLFSNILTMLSLANLGLGGVIGYSLYKPLEEHNVKKINAYMSFYKNAYNTVGIVIFILGISLIPFLEHFMNEVPNIPHLKFIYLLYLINTTISYFFVYKSSIIIADQKNYIVTRITCCFTAVLLIVQIIILLITKNYILYLLVAILFTIFQNMYVAFKANKSYPMIKLKLKEKLEKSERRAIFKNLFAMALYNVSGVVYSGTDNIIISSFISLRMVGMFSNYVMILQAVKMLLNQIFHSLIASVGNLNVTESDEKKYNIFKVMFFMSFWLFGLCSIAILVLINPFIILWLGESMLFSNWNVVIISLDLFIGGLILAPSVFKNSSGLYWQGKFAPVICIIINLVLSIILVNYIGVAGVLIGTIVSRIFTYSWVEPYVAYKYIFKKPIKEYIKRWAGYLLTTIITAYITYRVALIAGGNTFFDLILKAIICILIPNIVFGVLFHKTEEFKYLKQISSIIVIKIFKHRG